MRRLTLLTAWLYTGPVGHLYGTAADIVELWGRWGFGAASTRLRRRTAGT